MAKARSGMVAFCAVAAPRHKPDKHDHAKRDRRERATNHGAGAACAALCGQSCTLAFSTLALFSFISSHRVSMSAIASFMSRSQFSRIAAFSQLDDSGDDRMEALRLSS